MDEKIKEAIIYLTTKYDRNDNYLVDGEPRYTAHAFNLEEKHKIDGIAGYEAAFLMVRGIPNMISKVNAEIDKFKNLNPELEKLEFNKNSFTESYRTLTGITSQYNVDDINYYIATIDKNRRDENRDTMIENLKVKGVNLGWTPSPKTLRKINNKINAKNNISFVGAMKLAKAR